MGFSRGEYLYNLKEGTKTLKLVITLCVASVCKLGKQDLSTPSGLSGLLSFMEGARSISFTVFITLFFCVEKYFKELESFIII